MLLRIAFWTAFLVVSTCASEFRGGSHSQNRHIRSRIRRDSPTQAIFKIKLDNGTTVEISAGPKDSEFAECLAELTEDEKSNVVRAKDLNACAKTALKTFQKQVKRHLRIQSLTELPYVAGNLSRVEHMSTRIVKHIDNVQKQMKRMRMEHVEGTLFHQTLNNAQDAFRGVGEMASLRSANLVSNIQHFVKDFNRSMTNFEELVDTKGGDKSNLPDMEVITRRLQKDIHTLHNLTDALPTLQDSRRLTDQTVANFTIMMRNLTIGLPEVVRRMGPLRDRRGANQIRDFMTVVNDNMRNVSQSLSQQPLQRNGRSDIFSAVDGFQSAMGHMGAAFHDLLRGTLAIMNPAAWQPILPLAPRPLRERPLLDPRPFLGSPLIDRRASQDGRPLALLRPVRPPVGLLALQRVMELGMNRRQHIFDRFAPLPLNPRSVDPPDSRERETRQKKDDKKED